MYGNAEVAKKQNKQTNLLTNKQAQRQAAAISNFLMLHGPRYQ